MDNRISELDRSSGRWSLGGFFLGGSLLGAVAGFAIAWLDYGRPEIGFMYGYVLGLALVLGVAGLAVAAFRNWAKRNPMG